MTKDKRGFGLVEAVVAISMVAGFIVALAAVNTIYVKISFSQNSKIQAAFLAEEGMEAMRFARDAGWDANIAPLSNGAEYYLAFTGAFWQATTVPNYLGAFDRRIRLEAVNRDANDDIVSSGGALDPNTRLITSTVSWSERGATSTKMVSTYLTDLFAN